MKDGGRSTIDNLEHDGTDGRKKRNQTTLDMKKRVALPSLLPFSFSPSLYIYLSLSPLSFFTIKPFVWTDAACLSLATFF